MPRFLTPPVTSADSPLREGAFGKDTTSPTHVHTNTFFNQQNEEFLQIGETGKHFSKLSAQCYDDRSLHLLAFDLMYCCRTYNYYKGLTVPSTGKVKRKGVSNAPTAEELARKEEERLARIESIEQEIEDLERSADGCEDISLLGVQVTSTQYGVGTVIGQEANKISVQFSDVQKNFILDKKYQARPRFEDDEAIVEAFTVYGRAQEQIKRLQRELELLQK